MLVEYYESVTTVFLLPYLFRTNFLLSLVRESGMLVSVFTDYVMNVTCDSGTCIVHSVKGTGVQLVLTLNSGGQSTVLC